MKKVIFTLSIVFMASILVAQTTSFVNLDNDYSNNISLSASSNYSNASNSSNYTSVSIVKFTTLESVKTSRNFSIKLDGQVREVLVDKMNARLNGDYQLTGYIDNGPGIAFTTVQFSYLSDHGYSGFIVNDSLGINYQIVPLESEVNSVAMEYSILMDFDDVMIQSNGNCSTPPTEPELEDEEGENETELRTCHRRIRVLFLFTNRVTTSGLDPVIVSENVINELNDAVEISSQGDIPANFINAGAVNLSTFLTEDDMADDLEDLSNDADAQQLRDDHFADLVVLLTNQPGYNLAGRALDIKTNEENAYAIAQVGFAAFGFTASHEIGHLMGARHQRCSTCGGGFLGISNGCDIFTKGHGYDVCENNRTIMYQNGCDTRTRMGRFSDDQSRFMECSTGDNRNDNIRNMRNHACEVSEFRDSPAGDTDFSIRIVRPDNYCIVQNDPVWYVDFFEDFNSPNTYTYNWELSVNGLSNWCNLGSNTSVSYFGEILTNCLSGMNPSPKTFYIRVTVTNQLGVSQTRMVWASIKDISDCHPHPDSRSIDHHKSTISVYPNPVVNEMNISGSFSEGYIFSSDGKLCKVIHGSNESVATKNMNELSSGVYYLVIQTNEEIITRKIIKI